MEIIARDWHLAREVTALDMTTITTEKIDFHRRNFLSELLVSADTLVPTMYKKMEQKLPPAPERYAPTDQAESKASGASRSPRRLSKSYLDWSDQLVAAMEEHCWSSKGAKNLMDIETRYDKGRASKGWEIRSHLNLHFTRDEKKDEDFLFDYLLRAMIEDEALQVLHEWLSLNDTPSTSALRENGMKELVAWRTIKHLAAIQGSGIDMLFHKQTKYLLAFYRSECRPELAYQIIDCLKGPGIRSAIILLDRGDLRQTEGITSPSSRKNAA
jgi:hypothetical protein